MLLFELMFYYMFNTYSTKYLSVRPKVKNVTTVLPRQLVFSHGGWNEILRSEKVPKV